MYGTTYQSEFVALGENTEDANFDVKRWINESLSHATQRAGDEIEDGKTKEKKSSDASDRSAEASISIFATKLQLLAKDVNLSIRASMEQILRAIPNTIKEIDIVETELQCTREKLNAVIEDFEDARKKDRRTLDRHGDIDNLVKLDKIRTNMHQCRGRLEGAANWSRLVRNTESEMDKAQKNDDAIDLSAIVRDLQSLKSMQLLLKDMPAAQDRATTLKTLDGKFESLLIPMLDRRLSYSSPSSSRGPAPAPMHRPPKVSEIRPLVAVFKKVGRIDIMRRRYAERRALAFYDSRWRPFSEKATKPPGDDEDDDTMRGTSVPGTRICRCVSDFYDEALRVFLEEIRVAVDALFPDALEDDAADVIDEVDDDNDADDTVAIDASKSARTELSSVSKFLVLFTKETFGPVSDDLRRIALECDALNVLHLTQLFEATKEFAAALVAGMGQHRMSDGESVTSAADSILRVLGRAFRTGTQTRGPLDAYGTLERDYLIAELEKLNISDRFKHLQQHQSRRSSREDATDAIDSSFFGDAAMVASDALPLLFIQLESAVSRCVSLSEGVDAIPFLDAVEAALDEFMNQLNDVFGQMQRVVVALESEDDAKKAERTRASKRGEPSSSTMDLNDLFGGGDDGDDEGSGDRTTGGSGLRPDHTSLTTGASYLLLLTFRLGGRMRSLESFFRQTLMKHLSRVDETMKRETKSDDATNNEEDPVSILSVCMAKHELSSRGDAFRTKLMTRIHAGGVRIPSPVSDNTSLLRNAHKRVETLATSARLLFFRLMLVSVSDALAKIRSLEIWAKGSVTSASEDADDDEAHAMPQYFAQEGLWVQQISEHFFDLVRQLETIGTSMAKEFDALPADTMRGMQAHASALADRTGWSEVASTLGLAKAFRRDPHALFLSPTDDAATASKTKKERATSNAHAFIESWISAVAHAATGRVVSALLSIPKLSDSGAKQLATDVEHYQNVLKALGVSPEPMLSVLRESALASTEKLHAAANANDSAAVSELTPASAMRLHLLRVRKH